MKIYAHRGAGSDAPENSIPAFESALNKKYVDGIEIDVHLTADHVPVVIHDFDLERTTNGYGKIGTMSYRELRSFALRGLSSTYQIPTLDEVLQLVHQQNKDINIELKAGNAKYPNIERIVIELIHKYALSDATILSSFDHHALLEAKKIDANIHTGALTENRMWMPQDYMKAIQASYYHPPHYHTDEALVQSIHDHGFHVVSYTPNSREEIQAMIDAKIDIIITNHPDLASELLHDNYKKKA